MHFKTLRGVDLDNLRFTFTHANSDFPGCDSIAGGDCSLLGVPTLENETIDLNLALDVRLTVTSFLLTYGVTDRVDVGVVLPLVSISLEGTSNAQINPFGPPPAVHFFGGTPENPDPDRLPLRRWLGHRSGRRRRPGEGEPPPGRAALGRRCWPTCAFPPAAKATCSAPGAFAARGLAIVSARFGDFSPHANLGYLYRGGAFRERRRAGAPLGFDHLLAPWATLAVDLSSRSSRSGDSPLQVPGPVVIQSPYRRVITPTTIPERRDDVVDGSLGVKLTAASGLTVLANSEWPLNRGGLRPDVIWTVGMEYNF